ncbi:MAG: hypothetical protein WCS87_13465 [Methylococcaceae bacterium]
MQLTTNADDLNAELNWLNEVIETRFKLFFEQECAYSSVQEVNPPILNHSSYAQCLEQYHLGFAERIALSMALAAVLRPELLDVFFLKNKLFDRRFTEFGGATSTSSGFMPSLQTLLFAAPTHEIKNI